MKNVTSKIVSFICVICMAFTSGMIVYAAESTPKISVTMDKTKKNAEIKLNNVGMMIYSAQLTLNVRNGEEYTVTSADKSAYSALKTENNTVTLYIDSTALMDGSKEIKLASLKSDKEMSIGSTAELILVDRSMRDHSYNNVRVSVKSNDSTANSDSSGGSGSSGINSGVIAGVSGNPVVPAQTFKPVQSGFTDVENHWAKDSIKYVTAAGLFSGTSDTTFEPETKMTRAMYVTVLNRFGTKIDGKWQIACDAPMSFIDIDDGEWYSEAVGWAGGTGLVSGIGDNAFGPYYPVTREQIAVMTVNFAKLCGVELKSDIESAEFTDAESINDWAAEAVRIAQQAGIIYGREDGTFAPGDTATRAEVAAILHRFIEITK